MTISKLRAKILAAILQPDADQKLVKESLIMLASMSDIEVIRRYNEGVGVHSTIYLGEEN